MRLIIFFKKFVVIFLYFLGVFLSWEYLLVIVWFILFVFEVVLWVKLIFNKKNFNILRIRLNWFILFFWLNVFVLNNFCLK